MLERAAVPAQQVRRHGVIGIGEQALAGGLEEVEVVAPCGNHVLKQREAIAVPFVDARWRAGRRGGAARHRALGQGEKAPAIEAEESPLLRGDGVDVLVGLQTAILPLEDRRRQVHLVGPAAAAQARRCEKAPAADREALGVLAARNGQALVLDEAPSSSERRAARCRCCRPSTTAAGRQVGARAAARRGSARPSPRTARRLAHRGRQALDHLEHAARRRVVHGRAKP